MITDHVADVDVSNNLIPPPPHRRLPVSLARSGAPVRIPPYDWFSLDRYTHTCLACSNVFDDENGNVR